MIYDHYSDAASLPQLVRPEPEQLPNLVAVVFEFMKRLPAQFCIRRALDPVSRVGITPAGVFEEIAGDGVFQQGLAAERDGERLFIETSSGNMGSGLAEICSQLGLRLVLLLPNSVDESTRQFIQDMGATIVPIDTVDQNVRVQRLREIKAEYEKDGWRVTWVAQYENHNNPLAYWRLAELLAGEMDRISQLVGPVGTGGSTVGTAKFLRRAGFPNMKLVGVDACGSVNFGHRGGDYLLGGLGSDRPMPFVEEYLDRYDTVHWLDDNTAFASAVSLYKAGLPVGGSSGAAYLAARYEAQVAPDQVVLVICPDHARRYEATFRSGAWREAKGVDLTAAKTQPVPVRTPAEADPATPGVAPGWYRIDWQAYRQSPGHLGS